MKTTFTFDEFDILCDRLSNSNFRCENWWPTVEEIQTYIEPNINKNIEFLCWIIETASPPQTAEEKKSKTYINKLLIKTLKMVDDEKGNDSATCD